MTHLTEPLNSGRLSLKNRLVMPPMATAKADETGKVSKALLDYYHEKSLGGYLSLIIIEHSFVSQSGKASEHQLSVAGDEMVEGLKTLAGVMHSNGSKTMMQINHAGSAANKTITGLDPVGPSAVENPRKQNVPRELSREEIKAVIGLYRDASVRVQKAGFDGVEIHSAHGYLLNQFYSPLTNKRKDEYGGDTSGRIKIHLDIIRAIREAAGAEFSIAVRLGASDYMEGGTTIDDSVRAAKEFEKAGVDMLDISGGFCGFIVPGLSGQGYFAELTEAIKKVVSIPVMLTGGITDANAAEKLLSEGKADLIGVGRAIYSDSKWAEKAMKNVQG
ncbi:MAG: NADH:flavin oxidoreductase [Desulfobacteraceae bacterium]|nr:NADH:flavin oxidoreductase [Desulfobacteraceae bacterium]MBU4053195.1 NADH:flavin oxidoreductase [Pseudomonadota bacterium]